MLTNWKTIQNSIKRLKKLDEQLSKENTGFSASIITAAPIIISFVARKTFGLVCVNWHQLQKSLV